MRGVAEAAVRPAGRVRAGVRLRADAALPVLLGVLALLARRPVSMIRAPLWVDEAWAATAVKVPLSGLRGVTASTPIGWAMLLRLVPPVGPPERLRVVPLLFAALIPPVAYALGRELDPEHRVTALVMGVVAAFCPAALLRHDLKQYTADAFVTVLLVWLGARRERLRTPRALATLAGSAAAGSLFSHATVFVSAAVFGGLVAAALVARRIRDAAVTAAAGAGAAAFMGVGYLVFTRHGRTPVLVDYWHAYFVPSHGVPSFLVTRAHLMLDLVGVGPPLVTLALLVVAVVLLWRAGRPATALVLPLLSLVVVLAGAAKLYPLWEKRTGLFFYVFGALLLAYVLARAAVAAAGRAAVAGLVVLALGAVLLWHDALPAARTQVPYENSAGFSRYLATHAVPGEPIVLDRRAAYGFAFYWPRDRATYHASRARAVGWVPAFDPAAGIWIVQEAERPRIAAALDEAVAAAGTRPVWVVLTHTKPSITRLYLAALKGRGTVTTVSEDGGLLLRLQP
jgi:hypothetical protein